MILAALLVALLAPVIQEQSGADQLDDRSFYIIGWYCNSEGCLSNPRRLSKNVRFDPVRSKSSLAKAKHLTAGWSVTLNCKVMRDRLKTCRVEDDSTGSKEAEIVAIKIAQSIYTEVTPEARRSGGARAIISIEYAKGDCPPWHCTIIPPPPPPPPAQ